MLQLPLVTECLNLPHSPLMESLVKSVANVVALYQVGV